MVFKVRDLLVRQKTQTINALRGHLAELGVIAPQGLGHVSKLAAQVEDPTSALPEDVRSMGSVLVDMIRAITDKIHGLDVELARRADTM